MEEEITNNIPENILYYTAGIFDGEGCVCLMKTKPTPKNHQKNIRFWLSASIAMCHYETINYLHNHFGGKIYIDKSTPSRPLYSLRFVDRGAVKFLLMILPYLITKKEVAQLGIEFFTTKKRPTGYRLGTSDEEMAKRWWYHDEIKRINHLD